MGVPIVPPVATGVFQRRSHVAGAGHPKSEPSPKRQRISRKQAKRSTRPRKEEAPCRMRHSRSTVEFIALAGGLAAVLVIGDGAYFASRRSAAHAQPVPSESGTLTQPATPLNGAIASSNAEATSAAAASPETESAAATNSETPPTALEDLPWNLRLVNREHPRRRLRAQQLGRAARRELGGAPRQPPSGRPHR